MYTADDLKDMPMKDLLAELATARKELADLRLRARLGQENKFHKIGAQQKYVARIETFIQKNQTKVA